MFRQIKDIPEYFLKVKFFQKKTELHKCISLYTHQN